eukprot:1160861-Pelagomonas_calceolata.AAC.2
MPRVMQRSTTPLQGGVSRCIPHAMLRCTTPLQRGVKRSCSAVLCCGPHAVQQRTTHLQRGVKRSCSAVLCCRPHPMQQRTTPLQGGVKGSCSAVLCCRPHPMQQRTTHLLRCGQLTRYSSQCWCRLHLFLLQCACSQLSICPGMFDAAFRFLHAVPLECGSQLATDEQERHKAQCEGAGGLQVMSSARMSKRAGILCANEQ